MPTAVQLKCCWPCPMTALLMEFCPNCLLTREPVTPFAACEKPDRAHSKGLGDNVSFSDTIDAAAAEIEQARA